MTTFGERLKNLRERKGETQKNLGQVIGKSKETISKYEMGDREPDIESILAFARHFNVTADYLLGLNPYKQDNSNTGNPIVHENSYAYLDVNQYKDYLKDPEFLRYLRLAVKIKQNELDLESIERIIDGMVRLKKKLKDK